MEKIIHICFSESGRASLKQAIIENKLSHKEKVIALFDNISQGPIRDVINIEERVNWHNKLTQEDKYYYDDIESLKQNYNDFYDGISKISERNTVYLWYGQCSSEMCGMMYTIKLLKNKLSNIYLINVTDKITKYSQGIYIPKSVAEITPRRLMEYIKVRKKLNFKQYEDLLEWWTILKKENSMIRVFIDGNVRSVKQDYYDIDILKYTQKNLEKPARIVGSVLGYSETRISDDYIFWRIKELVKFGELRYKGKFGVMREMKICITDKGLNHLSNDPKAIQFWNKRESELQKDRDFINQVKNQGALEERIRIAKNLLDVLDVKTISQKVGLTEKQIKNI